MKATRGRHQFRLESPGAGAYRVRLIGAEPTEVATALFAGANDVQFVTLKPGDYTAWIEPIGSANTVTQVVRLDKRSEGAVFLHDDFGATPVSLIDSSTARPSWSGDAAAREKIDSAGPSQPRAFSIGVSVDMPAGARGRWRAKAPRLTLEAATGDGLSLVIRRPAQWRDLPRWQLTVAVEDDAQWRIPLPLFKGGLQLLFTPVEAPTGLDVALIMLPRDPAKAALAASLDQLFADSPAQVVQSNVGSSNQSGSLQPRALDLLSSKMEDPGAAAAAALLLARNNQIGPFAKAVRRLCERYPWLADAKVAMAWAVASGPGSRERVEARCLAEIKAARSCRAPYFVAAHALALEMLTALALGGGGKVREAAARERERWVRRSRHRMPTGPYFSWEEPARRKTGRLSTTYHVLLAAGKLRDGKIVAQAARLMKPRRSKAAGPPGLHRRIARREDPNKGRFGGLAERGGFRLSAEFGRGLHEWVQVMFRITAPKGTADREVVELCLHDSFEPDRVTLPFVNRVAEYSVLSWGGFTAGAWIPHCQTELELDLSEIADAPPVIRDL
jgi:pYEATS domain-containing protein involved in immunity